MGTIRFEWLGRFAAIVVAIGFAGTGDLHSFEESIISKSLSPSDMESIEVSPKTIDLDSTRSRQSLVVTAQLRDGSTVDVTALATVVMEPKGLAEYVNECVVPQSDGKGVLNIRVANLEKSIPLVVLGANHNPPVQFRNEVIQILTKSGCNSGKCHGAASGKDGFRLSLFGYDPEGDHNRLVHEVVGRRVSLINPEQSLLLLKGTGEVPHTGGQCFETDSESYALLKQWIREGASIDPVGSTTPVSVEVFPKKVVFSNPTGEQKLLVMATFSDGTQRDVTRHSVFLSNNEAAAAADESGMVTAKGVGASFILARFDKFTQGTAVVVRPGTPFPESEHQQFGKIDEFVDQRLDYLHITASPLASDEQFLRRVTLDLAGRLPTLDEYNTFRSSINDDKRSKKIDELLGKPEFQDLWVMRWAELLQIRTNNGISPKALQLYDEWLRKEVHRGVTIDNIVKQILPSSGGTMESPATNYYQTETTPQLIAENVAQVFLGTRIQCAQCHNHPFDRWTMDDYYGFASFFSQIGYKQSKDPRELMVFNTNQGNVEHLISGRHVAPKFLGMEAPAEIAGRDYREVLAEWLASKENVAFRNNIANIVWSHFFGIGIVEPVDDFRASNPPSNPELLNYLGERIAFYKFDIRELAREICNSRAYQTATQRNDLNRLDEREFSHQKIRRLRAEVLLDCLSQVTESQERLPGLPMGGRAVQVADGLASHYFLSTFGRSNRATPCTCEVKTSPTLSQALHLLNGESTTGKIQQGNIVGKWLEEGQSSTEVVKNLYRTCLSRECTEAELRDINHELISNYTDVKTGLEDLFWALLNSNEFIFNH